METRWSMTECNYVVACCVGQCHGSVDCYTVPQDASWKLGCELGLIEGVCKMWYQIWHRERFHIVSLDQPTGAQCANQWVRSWLCNLIPEAVKWLTQVDHREANGKKQLWPELTCFSAPGCERLTVRCVHFDCSSGDRLLGIDCCVVHILLPLGTKTFIFSFFPGTVVVSIYHQQMQQQQRQPVDCTVRCSAVNVWLFSLGCFLYTHCMLNRFSTYLAFFKSMK